MSKTSWIALFALCSSLILSGCGKDESATPTAPPLSPELARGKTIWEGTCKVCHQLGIAEAPRIGDTAAWAPRIAQGMETLVSHATNGFTGKHGTMPARGGNASLADEDVAAAVAYMVSQSK